MRYSVYPGFFRAGGNTFPKFWKRFLTKIAKIHYFSIFFKNLPTHPKIFARLVDQILWKSWENIDNFWWKLYRKIEVYFLFIFILEDLLLLIEPSEITPFSYNNFSCFGWPNFPLPPCLALVSWFSHIWLE